MDPSQTLVEAGIQWLNDNQGVLAIGLFLASAAYAWFSGIIEALRRRPKLLLSLLPGPTFFVVHEIGKTQDEYEIHRLSISVYLKITNAGSAPTSICDVHIGYKWSVIPFTGLWWSRLGKVHWITRQTVALRDFQVAIGAGGDAKVYPFLTQRSSLTGHSSKTYLEIGEMVNGVVYFEQSDAFGACQPLVVNDHAAMYLKIYDAFGGVHKARMKVPKIELEAAKEYNPSFGGSLSALASSSSESGPTNPSGA